MRQRNFVQYWNWKGSVKSKVRRFTTCFRKRDGLRKRFIEECVSDCTRYQKAKTTDDNTKYAVTSADKKLQEVGIARDVFGNTLYLALEKKVDMEEVLKYPLTPVPLSLCHIDGSMLKSSKSKLMNRLEKQVDNNCPSCIDSTIIDDMFFLHLQKNMPEYLPHHLNTLTG